MDETAARKLEQPMAFFKTLQGDHYHENPGCPTIVGHGIESCTTDGLEPCTVCCGGGSGGGSGAGAVKVSPAIPVGTVPLGTADAESLIEEYGSQWEMDQPISRIVELPAAVMADYEDGTSDATPYDSSFVRSIRFEPAPPKDAIVVEMDVAFAKSRGMDYAAYTYTGSTVTRETYEAIVSSSSIGKAVNHFLIYAPSVKYDAVPGSTVVSLPKRGTDTAESGVRTVNGTDATVPDVQPSQVANYVKSDKNIRDATQAAARGTQAPLPPVVTMKVPTDPDDRQRVMDLGLDITVDGKRFEHGLKQVRVKLGDYGCYVDVKSPDELRNDVMIMTEDGLTGCAVTPDGDIVGVYNASDRKGTIRALMAAAAANGGKKMDCYARSSDPRSLVTMYQMCGFEPVARVPFNPEFVEDTPENAKLLQDRPDVYVLKRRADMSDHSVMSREELEALPLFADPENGYDQALAYRDELLKQQERTREREDADD